MLKQVLFFISFLIFISCSDNKSNSETVNSKKETINFKDSIPEQKASKNLWTDFIPMFIDGDINVVIEIPAGTIEKWEVDKSDGQVKHEIKNNKPRIIQYIGYPGNYGMVPRTLLPKELGGDGDPLDVIVLGPPVERGSVVKCKLIGVLNLLDHGENDDKLIAVLENTPLYQVNSIEELDHKYHGISEIIQLWFTNYKGPGKLESIGFGDKDIANTILKSAMAEYILKNNN